MQACKIGLPIILVELISILNRKANSIKFVVSIIRGQSLKIRPLIPLLPTSHKPFIHMKLT